MNILIKIKINEEIIAERYIEIEDCDIYDCIDFREENDCISDLVYDWKRHNIKCDWERLE